VVTPRTGKAVEISALWYNALKITAELAKANKESKQATRLNKKAELTASSFVTNFWCKEKKYLYDYLGDTINNDALRPNQIIALSLPFELVPEKQAKAVLKAVEQHLLTPYGLRSLSDQDPYYRGVYEGNQWSRDGAYHQGTVWSWLLGPYYTAKVRLEGEEGKAKALKHIEKFRTHLSEAGMGTVSEIFGGDKPFKADGCIAQAWGVSEVLRAYVEDIKSK
jgi:predicted glycogen debranching enzyme